MKKLIAVTGGIGAGKSVVCRILLAMGFPVYDCDSRAKLIMDSDAVIKERLRAEISPLAVAVDGSLVRSEISKVVFSDPDKLALLNSIVHSAVRDDLARWLNAQIDDLCFVETAILYQSGLDRVVDSVWEVAAPYDVRVERVCRRSGLSPQQVVDRIKAQSIIVDNPHARVSVISNDDSHSLLLQINRLLALEA